ncbi:MAG: hypothetical protein M9941_10860 [Anaerolineae bacterium]|nr:hypothetical protein [Anaerolineae bacterium]MCO5198229.1 hypothetical protein [Anaerolineae bacterium]
MKALRSKRMTTLLLAAVILLSGLAFFPFASLSADSVSWKQFANAYLPTLNIDEDKGLPGSGFIFEASGYPPNTTASVYAEGVLRGTVMTDSNGNATFGIQTASNDPLGRYDITMSTDANNSATNDLRLESDRPLLVIPPGFPHPIFDLFGSPPGDTVISRKIRSIYNHPSQPGRYLAKVQAVNPATMSPVAGATVNVTLTLPDGTTMPSSITNGGGWAKFQQVSAGGGNCTLTVNNITAPGYTFDPLQGVTTQTVPCTALEFQTDWIETP